MEAGALGALALVLFHKSDSIQTFTNRKVLLLISSDANLSLPSLAMAPRGGEITNFCDLHNTGCSFPFEGSH